MEAERRRGGRGKGLSSQHSLPNFLVLIPVTQVLLRYYHVFEEGELEELVEKVEGLVVVESYYDQGNWCSVLERV